MAWTTNPPTIRTAPTTMLSSPETSFIEFPPANARPNPMRNAASPKAPSTNGMADDGGLGGGSIATGRGDGVLAGDDDPVGLRLAAVRS